MLRHKKLKLQQEDEQQALLQQQNDHEETLSGLYLFGDVVDRSKRTISQTSIEVVTLFDSR